MNHKMYMTPTAVEAALGFFINTGCTPKQLEMKNMTSGDQVKVVSDSSSDPLAFVDAGILQDVSATPSTTKLTNGISMTYGQSDTNALLPATFTEDVNGTKTYRDISGREILAFKIIDNTAAALDVVSFNVGGAAASMTEGTDWDDGADAAATATSLAAYITASVSNVTAVADGIIVYLIKEEGYTLDTLAVTGAGITAHNQPVVLDMKGNNIISEPNLKGILGKCVSVNAAIVTASEKLQFDIQI